MTTGISRLRTKHALAMAWLVLTIPPAPLLWASTKAMETGVDVSILPGISAILQNMGAQRIPQDAAAFFCIFAVATWMLVQLQALLADVRQRQPTGFRKEPAAHFAFTLLWAWPASMILSHHPVLPGLAAAAEVLTFVALTGIAWRFSVCRTRPGDPTSSLFGQLKPALRDIRNAPGIRKISLGKTPPPAPDGGTQISNATPKRRWSRPRNNGRLRDLLDTPVSTIVPDV